MCCVPHPILQTVRLLPLFLLPCLCSLTICRGNTMSSLQCSALQWPESKERHFKHMILNNMTKKTISRRKWSVCCLCVFMMQNVACVVPQHYYLTHCVTLYHFHPTCYFRVCCSFNCYLFGSQDCFYVFNSLNQKIICFALLYF